MKLLHAQERMPTGVPGLDHLLRGGLVRGNSMLIQGPPGSGKTTFAIRMIHEGIIRYNEPGLIITFEEFPKQIYQEAMSYGLDLGELEASGKLRIVWTTPTRILDGFTGKNDLIDKIVHETKVRRLMIDSVTHFRRVAPSEVALREVLANILSYLKIRTITSVLIKELERTDEQAIPFEEYLVDASMRLSSAASPTGGEDVRLAEVRKTRGQAHISGKHPFELAADGPRIFPHLSVEDVRAALPSEPRERERIAGGIAGLDAMLGGGLWRPSICLVGGWPGSGKSVLASAFIDEGLRAGERCLLAALKPSEGAARTLAAGLGMDWTAQEKERRLQTLEFPSTAICLERIENALLETMQTFRPQRIVLDALDDLRAIAHNEDRLHDFLHVFAAMTRRAGAATLVLSESPGSGGEGGASRSHGYNYIADTVLRIGAELEGDSPVRRIHVAKHAGGGQAADARRFEITDRGIELAGAPSERG